MKAGYLWVTEKEGSPTNYIILNQLIARKKSCLQMLYQQTPPSSRHFWRDKTPKACRKHTSYTSAVPTTVLTISTQVTPSWVIYQLSPSARGQASGTRLPTSFLARILVSRGGRTRRTSAERRPEVTSSSHPSHPPGHKGKSRGRGRRHLPAAPRLAPAPVRIRPGGEARALRAARSRRGAGRAAGRAPSALAGAATRLNHPTLHVKSPLGARGTLGRPGAGLGLGPTLGVASFRPYTPTGLSGDVLTPAQPGWIPFLSFG